MSHPSPQRAVRRIQAVLAKGTDHNLVDHGRTGLLVDHGDVEGLAGAISQALSDGALRRRMGQAAREEALRRFKVADIACRTRQVYYTVLEEGDHARHRWRH